MTIVRIDDFPTGIRPLFFNQLFDFQTMLTVLCEHGIKIHLGCVPDLLDKFNIKLEQNDNVVICQHGFNHRYFEYSSKLLKKNDIFNTNSFGSFNEFEGLTNEQIADRIKTGKSILEHKTGKEIDTYIPVCNVIDNNICNILEQTGFKTVLTTGSKNLNTKLNIINSEYYGRLENFDFKYYDCVCFHLNWEWDSIQVNGLAWWFDKVKLFAKWYKEQSSLEPYKILFKYPIRYRFNKFFETLNKYYELIADKNNFEFLITIDEDDKDLNNKKFIDKLKTYDKLRYEISSCKNKIQAVNHGIDRSNFDIVVIVSDDMIPQVEGFDNIIRKEMKANYPDLDGCLWFNDGFQQNRINTLQICGKKYYERFGFIYHEAYVSQRSDVEFQMVAKRLNKITYIDKVIIKHCHADFGLAEYDKLLLHNYTFIKRDELVFIEREKINFAVGIPKIAHFIWNEETPLSYLRFMTIETFKKHNPDWEVMFWLVSGCKLTKTWEGSEKLEFFDKKQQKNYLNELKTDEIYTKKVENIAPNYASDLIRWQVLYDFGGFYFDLDQIILNSFDELLTYDVVYGGQKIQYSGVVGMFKSCLAAKNMIERTKNAIKTAKNYCDAGNWLWLDYVNKDGKQLLSEYQTFCTPQQYFYPIEQSFMMKEYYNGKKPDLKNAFAVHWFGGHPDSQEFNKKTESEINKVINKWE